METQIVVLKELVAGLDESIIECERIGVIEIESVVPGVFGTFQALLANHAQVDDIPELLDYEGLPLTRHALDGHANEKWNALTIPTEMTWNCTPKRYACTENGDDFEVHYCRVNDGKSIGLIIGRTVKQIMTGFMAKTEYWEDRCN